MDKQELIGRCLEKGFLLSPEMLIGEVDKEFFKLISHINIKESPVILDKDFFFVLKKGEKVDINWLEFEKSKALFEKGRDKKVYEIFLDLINYNLSEEKKEKLDRILEQVEKPEKNIVVEKIDRESESVVILKSHKIESKSIDVKDFVEHFRGRYNAIKGILQNRVELQEVISINRLKLKKAREEVSLIGLVYDKRATKNGNVLLEIEDLTGGVRVLISKDKTNLLGLVNNISLDEVIGIKGYGSGDIVFVNDIFFPDVAKQELKKAEHECYAAFISDLHVGSNMFLKEDFLKFIKWINGEIGSELQREVAKKIRYLFIVGDVVDGVGIYPGQDEDLAIKDVRKQYEACAGLLGNIRKDINIIIAPGNHDALRLSVPQPVLDKNYAAALHEMENVVLVGNPSLVNIHSSKDFQGFNILIYHGYGFHYFIDNIDSLRNGNARDNPNLVLKYLLQRRHLSPTHGSTLYVPGAEDYLVIGNLPDFIVTGELHRSDVSSYNNITLINCSCWQAKTDFQEKTGNNPDPSKVPIVNLKTREVKMMKFGDRAEG